MRGLGPFMQNLFGKAFIKPWMIDLADDHFEMDNSKAKKLLRQLPYGPEGIVRPRPSQLCLS